MRREIIEAPEINRTCNILEEKDYIVKDKKTKISDSIKSSLEYLLSLQKPEGYWEAVFEMDVRQTAEYMFLKRFLDISNSSEEKRMANYILKMELKNGGWGIHYDGKPDLSTTVTAYYALRLAGFAKDHSVLERARAIILDQGGLMEANCFTRKYFELFGQMHPDSLPAMPVEIMLLPKWFPFNIYAISSWTRAIMIPLLIITALNDNRLKMSGPDCSELIAEGTDPKKQPIKPTKELLTWHNLFLVLNNFAKLYEKYPIKWLRKIAVKKAHKWLVDHMGYVGGVAAIFPSMLNACIALVHLGYDKKHPLILNELKALENLKIEEDYCWMQPCVSTIWDTAWCFNLLPQLGLSVNHPAMIKTKEFLLDNQISIKGDWQEKIADIPCGGWCFENENSLYPDNDDTAAIMMGLYPYRKEERVKVAAQKALNWLFAMQCDDGGWAAFDYQKKVYDCFNYIPFAEHGALLDPPTSDVTGRVVEALGVWGYTLRDKPVYRAVTWLLEQQESDGSWYGRWGVNYIYGTWAVLCGLESVGFDMKSRAIRDAVIWILNQQNSDGGWGETCESYTDISKKGQGKSTASQTSWALMALAAAGEYDIPAVKEGISYLLRNQKNNGSWDEEEFTGTGFPGVCYLRYHLYKDAFPPLALTKLLPKLKDTV